MTVAPESTHPWIEILDPHLFAMNFPAKATDAELTAFLDSFYELAKSVEHRYGWIVDLEGVIGAPASQRKRYADNELRVAPYSAKYCVGTALIAHSGIARGLVTAVFWLKKPVYPYTIVASRAEAMAWVRERLVAEGIFVDTPTHAADRAGRTTAS